MNVYNVYVYFLIRYEFQRKKAFLIYLQDWPGPDASWFVAMELVRGLKSLT